MWDNTLHSHTVYKLYKKISIQPLLNFRNFQEIKYENSRYYNEFENISDDSGLEEEEEEDAQTHVNGGNALPHAVDNTPEPNNDASI